MFPSVSGYFMNHFTLLNSYYVNRPERRVDASLGIKWIVKGESWRKKARKFLRDSITAGIALIAPPLFEYETESVLQGRLHSGAMAISETDTSLSRLSAIGVQILTHPDMIKRAREIARQFNQPKFNQPNIYDSLYAALAELRGCEFWTADKAFYDAVKGGLSFVKHLPNYP
jgi:predicted nucleic acid-binding protein